MTIDCHCPSCGAHLKVDSTLAGRKVTCPKCGGKVLVSLQAARPLPVARPLGADEVIEPQPPAVAADAELGSVERIAPRDDDVSGSDTANSGVDGDADGLPHVVVAPGAGEAWNRLRGEGRSVVPPIPTSRAGRPQWLIATAIGATLITVIVGGILAHRFGGGGPTSATRPQAVLAFDWPADQRGDAAVYIDGHRREVAASGPLEFTLGSGRHRVVVLRRGYEQVETSVQLEPSGRRTFRPDWVASPPASPDPAPPVERRGGWLQDIEVAKRRAAEEHKDVLIAFEASGNAESDRLRRGILSERTFREMVAWRFVLVSVDVPVDAEAWQPVEDPDRNRQAVESFHVSDYPTFVLADAEGRPYAIERFPRSGNIESLVSRLAQWQAIRERRDAAFLAVERARGDEQLAAIEEAADLLTDMNLARYYGPTLDRWLALVEAEDPNNAKGAQEAVFEVRWLGRLLAVDEDDVGQLDVVLAELDDFKAKFPLKDPDRAAMMHLAAAARLAEAQKGDEAVAYLDQARGYEPRDPRIVILLGQIEAALQDRSSGTGFAVARGGYILTNYHVIEDSRKSSVRLPDREEPLPAKILAQDTQRDMALLKIELPDGVDLKPLHIGEVELPRGAAVGVFGFPGGEAMGTGLKLTTGVVSAGPAQSEERMYLLDCRVNPGNSGGPLCDTHGNVVGMVTAKISGFDIDSYGMALPTSDLLAFLKKHLPRYQQDQPPTPGAERLGWDEVDRLVSPSVVMIVGS